MFCGFVEGGAADVLQARRPAPGQDCQVQESQAGKQHFGCQLLCGIISWATQDLSSPKSVSTYCRYVPTVLGIVVPACTTVPVRTAVLRVASLYKLARARSPSPAGPGGSSIELNWGNERGHDHEVSALSKAPKMSVSVSMRLSRGGADRPHTASRRANARPRVEAATLRVRAVNKVRAYVAKLEVASSRPLPIAFC